MSSAGSQCFRAHERTPARSRFPVDTVSLSDGFVTRRPGTPTPVVPPPSAPRVTPSAVTSPFNGKMFFSTLSGGHLIDYVAAGTVYGAKGCCGAIRRPPRAAARFGRDKLRPARAVRFATPPFRFDREPVHRSRHFRAMAPGDYVSSAERHCGGAGRPAVVSPAGPSACRCIYGSGGPWQPHSLWKMWNIMDPPELLEIRDNRPGDHRTPRPSTCGNNYCVCWNLLGARSRRFPASLLLPPSSTNIGKRPYGGAAPRPIYLFLLSSSTLVGALAWRFGPTALKLSTPTKRERVDWAWWRSTKILCRPLRQMRNSKREDVNLYHPGIREVLARQTGARRLWAQRPKARSRGRCLRETAGGVGRRIDLNPPPVLDGATTLMRHGNKPLDPSYKRLAPGRGARSLTREYGSRGTKKQALELVVDPAAARRDKSVTGRGRLPRELAC